MSSTCRPALPRSKLSYHHCSSIYPAVPLCTDTASLHLTPLLSSTLISITGHFTQASPLVLLRTFCVGQCIPSCRMAAFTPRLLSSLRATCLLSPDKVQYSCSLQHSILSFSLLSLPPYLILWSSISIPLPLSLFYSLQSPSSPFLPSKALTVLSSQSFEVFVIICMSFSFCRSTILSPLSLQWCGMDGSRSTRSIHWQVQQNQ